MKQKGLSLGLLNKLFKFINYYIKVQQYKTRLNDTCNVYYDDEHGVFYMIDEIGRAHGPYICQYEAAECKKEYIDICIKEAKSYLL